MKLTLTNRMSAAIRVAQEFCQAMNLSTIWSNSLELEIIEEEKTTISVKIKFPDLPKPNCLCFTLHLFADFEWKPRNKDLITFSLPETHEKNEFYFNLLATSCGKETIGFERL